MTPPRALADIKHESIFTSKQFQHFLWLSYRKSLIISFVVSVIVAYIASYTFISLENDGWNENVLRSIFTLGIELGVMLTLFFLICYLLLLRLKTYRAHPNSQMPSSTTVSEKGITLELPGYFHSEYQWSLFKNWKETKHFITLSGHSSLTFRKKVYTAKELEQLRAFFSKKIAKKSKTTRKAR